MGWPHGLRLGGHFVANFENWRFSRFSTIWENDSFVCAIFTKSHSVCGPYNAAHGFNYVCVWFPVHLFCGASTVLDNSCVNNQSIKSFLLSDVTLNWNDSLEIVSQKFHFESW